MANAPLPQFASDEAAADYFAAHSVASVWDQLPAAKPGKLAETLTNSIEKRHSVRKAPISIRLGSEQIAAAKKIAAAKSVGYQTQFPNVDCRGDSARGAR